MDTPSKFYFLSYFSHIFVKMEENAVSQSRKIMKSKIENVKMKENAVSHPRKFWKFG